MTDIKQNAPQPQSDYEISPYQPPATPITEPTSEDEFELAGRGIRLVAYFADGLVFIFPFLLTFLIVLLLGRDIDSDDAINGLPGVFFLLMIVGIVVVNWIWLYRNGQTIGKRLLSIKIVRTDGSRAGLLRIIFLRFIPTGILSSIPLIGFSFTLLDPLLIFQKSRRCLHDLIADTIVIDAFTGTSTRRSTAVIVAVSIIPVLAIVGILAAIAIPAYMDYMNRSKVSEALGLLGGLKIPAEEYFADDGEFPPSVESIGGKTSGKYTDNIVSNPAGFYFQATMSGEEASISGQTIRLTFEPESGEWICRSGYPNGLDNMYLPSRCQN